MSLSEKMPLPKFLVYGLTDPRTGDVCYIGKSSSGSKRPLFHGRERALEKDYTRKACWIRSLQVKGLRYGVRVLGWCRNAGALDNLERCWIVNARTLGWPITNMTDGGDGSAGRIVGAEERARRSVAARLWQSTPEARAKMSAAKKAFYVAHPGEKAKQSAGMKAYFASHPEARQRIVDRQASPEARKTQSDKLKRFYDEHPEERIAAGVRSMKHQSSPEARAAKSAETLARYAEHPEARAAFAAQSRTAKAKAAAQVGKKAFFSDPIKRAAFVAKVVARHATSEARAVLSARSRAYFADPANRAAASAEAIARHEAKRKREQARFVRLNLVTK